MKLINVLGPLLAFAGLASAQAPRITGGPVNAASYVIAGLPNANIAQGSMFIVFGQNIGPSVQANASSFPLTATLGGTSISVTVGGTTVQAIMLYSTSVQVAAILPSKTPTGTGTLTLTFNNNTSNAVPIHVVASTLGIFTRNTAGSGPGVLFNFNSQSDQPVNSLVTAAHPGQVLTLWGTGLGAVSGDEAGGPLPGNLSVPVTVYVGTKQVTPSYKGRSGCCAGIDQVVFTVPEGVEGCYVSVNVVTGGVVSNSATIAVASNGTVCSDPTGFSTADLQKVLTGGTLTVADIGIDRDHAKLSSPLGKVEGNVDLGDGHFRHYVSSQDVLASTRGAIGALGGLPSAGSCTVSPFQFQDFFSSLFAGSGDPVIQEGLDAGPALNITGPLGVKQLPRQNIGTANQPFYRYHVHGSVIGGGIPVVMPVMPDFLDPGNYTLDNGAGGAQVGPFHANLTIPNAAITWTNEDALTMISRSQDLTVTWSAPSGAWVAVLGSAADPGTGAGASFQCVTSADPGTFTVPAWVLSALPASGMDASAGVPVGFLSVGVTLPQTPRFQASGVDIGFFNWAEIESKNVVYQ